MPTIGALGFATALAPTAVVPNGTTELGGGGVVDAETGAAASREAPAQADTATRPSSAASAQPRAGRRPGHPVHSLMASMSWRNRA